MKRSFLLIFIFTTTSVFSQFSWNSEVHLKGMVSTNDHQLPFWMIHNQRGRVLENSNVLGWVSGKAEYTFNNNRALEVGVGFLGREGSGDNFITDELYATYNSNIWSLTIGRKQEKELYNRLSASNRSILRSLNARPLPGIQLGTTRPIYLLRNFGLEASWEEFVMEDDRFVEDAKLHHKSFHLVYSTKERGFQLKAGVQHYVQWGGNSPVFGEQPESFKDYLRIISGQQGKEGATGSDQLNALGNHLGGYEFSLHKTFSDYRLELFYQHLFEDGSGRRLGNTPDGRYGLFIERNEHTGIINSLMYEFYTTHHQSHTTTGNHKNDNYFNNTGYVSGWTYYNRVLGSPFFSVNPEGYGIINNKFTAHHLGLGGTFSTSLGKHPYRLLLSYAQNDGTRHNRFVPKQDVLYALYEIKLLQKAFEVSLELGAEYDSYKSPIYGVGVHLIYRIL